MAALSVGIDVSKDHLDFHVRPSGQHGRVARDPEGIDDLLNLLLELQPNIIALEATGGLESVVAATFASAGLPVAIVNPAQVRSFAKALGKRAKTDPIDAAVIAHFAEATNPELRPLPDDDTRRLAELLARRKQILSMLTTERQRAAHMNARPVIQSSSRIQKALQKELHTLDKLLDDTIHNSPLWLFREQLLRSVPGVGPTIARTLLAEFPELGSLDRRQVASLAGLAPYTRQSGRWKGKSFVSGGRKRVRSALYMGALAAIRHNPVLRPSYDRLIALGKPKKVALIALARKLLTILNAILRDSKPWQHA